MFFRYIIIIEGIDGQSCHVPLMLLTLIFVLVRTQCCVFTPIYVCVFPSLANCIPPACSDQGVCVSGVCHCFSGYTGAGCAILVPGEWPPVCDICTGLQSYHVPQSSANNLLVHRTLVKYCEPEANGEFEKIRSC